MEPHRHSPTLWHNHQDSVLPDIPDDQTLSSLSHLPTSQRAVVPSNEDRQSEQLHKVFPYKQTHQEILLRHPESDHPQQRGPDTQHHLD